MLLLAACGGPEPAPTPDDETTGTLEGTISFGVNIPPTNAELLTSWADTPFVPGQLLIDFESGSSLSAEAATLSAADLNVEFVRTLASPSGSSALFENSSLSAGELLQLAEELGERSGISWAHPNYILEVQLLPADPLYAHQWHYPAINLPGAWDVTTGDPAGTVVAIVDSGILYSQDTPALRHPDLPDGVLPGYDFISDWSVAADGDGRDPDPFDMGGDNPDGSSSYHGTHVAGTIAAATDNGLGVAGIDWHARILPVRVLGVGGGSTIDIYEGMLWAAGFSIPGVPDNRTPARVINMSLGGSGMCPPGVQDAIDAVAAAGVITVVAAGNDNRDAWGFFPAACSNVITVGATDFLGQRAPYSNWGTRIDVMAPGGDMGTDWYRNGFPDGVLSPTFAETAGNWDYKFEQGTSMAAPHVAGVVSLMLSVNPDLGQEDARQLLAGTARPLSVKDCGLPDACGAGLIDAHAAVLAAAGYTGSGPGTEPPPPPEPEPGTGPAEPEGPLLILAFQEDADGELFETGRQSGSGIITDFSFSAEPGETMLAAWSDENGDGTVNAGDYFGVYPWPLTVRGGVTETGLELRLDQVVDGMALKGAQLLETLPETPPAELLPYH